MNKHYKTNEEVLEIFDEKYNFPNTMKFSTQKDIRNHITSLRQSDLDAIVGMIEGMKRDFVKRYANKNKYYGRAQIFEYQDALSDFILKIKQLNK